MAPAPAAQSTTVPAAPGQPLSTSTAELRALRAEIEQTRRELNERLERLGQALDQLLPGEEHPSSPPSAPPALPPPPALQVGQKVYVPRLGRALTIVDIAPSGKTALVQTGTMRVRVRQDEIGHHAEASADPPPRPSPQSATRQQPDLNPHIAEIDLHGFSEQEALITLDMFLHHAFTRRTLRVRIIHGKGDGILRGAVRRALADHPLVRTIESGPQYRGDDGVTLAELDV